VSGERYNPREMEPKWQQVWADAQSFVSSNDDPREPYYVLEMFPYPSGRIHMGHVRNYAMGDVVARYHRAKGKNVLHPMGWDAFGLPAENAAIERGLNPGVWTRQNITSMKAQLKSMGLAIDWTREIATCEPEYYQHQQSMFLDMLAAGLITRKKSKVNWDPVDMTVLANEQVIDGKGWRSGAVVEQRELNAVVLQDFRLCRGPAGSPGRPDRVAREGAHHAAQLDRQVRRPAPAASSWSRAMPTAARSIEVFTTRPDTIYGASFVALSPDHPLTAELAANNPNWPNSSPNAAAMGTATEAIETAEKRGYRTGLQRETSGHRRRGPARLRRQLRADGLWHRRYLRLPRA
jgi:leucyl-tRNA synthetase